MNNLFGFGNVRQFSQNSLLFLYFTFTLSFRSIFSDFRHKTWHNILQICILVIVFIFRKLWRNSDKNNPTSDTKNNQHWVYQWQHLLESDLSKFIFEIAKYLDDLLLTIWYLNGAKVCKYCRSRQELSKRYLPAKIGVGTAENEPFKVWRWFNSSLRLLTP